MWGTVLWIIGLVLCGAFLYGMWEGRTQALAENKKDQDHKALVARIQEKVVAFLTLRKSLALPAVPFTITDDVSDTLTESRFGGRAAWPKDTAHPAPRGQFPLCFLMQINLAEMPPLDGFPDHGLLQFFFAADDLYGMTFPEGQSDGPTNQSDIVIIHHAQTDNMIDLQLFGDRTEAERLDAPFRYDNWWDTGFRITFDARRAMEPSVNDFRLYDLFWELQKMFPSKKQFNEYADKWCKDDVLGPVIGGHPHFTQADPRENRPAFAPYTHCLLSIPTVNDKIMWGDCGTASFLMRPEVLRAHRFDDILYNYDCY